MQHLPSKSLSKLILLATPIFCIVLGLLDASDDLSYLFVLDFLGAVDIMMLPNTRPEVTAKDFTKQQAFINAGVNIEGPPSFSPVIPLVQLEVAQKWADENPQIRGVSPRWIIPVQVGAIDCMLLVINSTQQLSLGIGQRSNLQKLGKQEVSLPRQLFSRFGVSTGNDISISFSPSGLLSGSKTIQKYQSFQSKAEYDVDSVETDTSSITNIVYDFIEERQDQFSMNVSKEEVGKVVEAIFEAEFKMDFKVKNQFSNQGMYPTNLQNVIFMEFQGFANMLSTILIEKVVKSKDLEKLIFKVLQNSDISTAQLILAKTYYRSVTQLDTYNSDIHKNVLKVVKDYPLLVISSYNRREALYHPDQQQKGTYLSALQTTPNQYNIISIMPFYNDMSGIRFFFKSVIQIFSFICSVIYFYIMRLILRSVYEEKEIQVGIWRTLGAGGVKISKDQSGSMLAQKLSMTERISYGYKMLVKVGFFYYWLISSFISASLFHLTKYVLYCQISQVLSFGVPNLKNNSAIFLFLSVFTLIMWLVISHIRSIYTNPLVSTIKPVKRTFDLVKVRIIKMATFGISGSVFVTSIMLIYYGVVSYYFIPKSILYGDGWTQTFLFNTIFLFMILGSLILISVLQSRMECGVLEIFFFMSKRLERMRLVLLKSIRANQYKNIKVAIIISLIFAFLLFFASGLAIQIKIVQSVIERNLGAQIVLQNYQKNTFDKQKIQAYLSKLPNIKYAWLSVDLDNKNVKMLFYPFTSYRQIKSIFKTISPSYLNATLYDYYVPQYYQKDTSSYQFLPNGLKNGFSSIYDEKGSSVGRYDPQNSFNTTDPYHVNIIADAKQDGFIDDVPPKEQIIKIVVSSRTRKLLGVFPQDFTTLYVENSVNGKSYSFRCEIMHSMKVGPGLDLYSSLAFISEQQTKYIYDTIGADINLIKYEKLFISGEGIEGVGNKILSMSPAHTQLFEISSVRQTFEIMESYLQGFIVIVTVILAILSTMFLFLYTYGKCKEEASVFKMLRAVGMSATDIRIMVFVQILIRVLIAIFNGIVLGVIFSLGLSGQIQELLMINTPSLKLGNIFIIAISMLLLFSATLIYSTRYLANSTVLETSQN